MKDERPTILFGRDKFAELTQGLRTAANALKTTVGGASDVGFTQGLLHAPKTLDEARHVADGVASSFALGRETAHGAHKVKPIAQVANAISSRAAPVVNVAAKLAPASKFVATKAAPALWALDMGVQAADVYNNPEANKQNAMAMADKGVGSRMWSAVGSPVKTIAGTAQIAGDLAKTTADNYLEGNRFAKQQQQNQQKQFFGYKPPLSTDSRLAQQKQAPKTLLASR
jgi:hypothetical protein